MHAHLWQNETLATFSRVTQDETLFTCFTFDDSFYRQAENLFCLFFRACRSTIVFVKMSFTRPTFHFGRCIHNRLKRRKVENFLPFLVSLWTTNSNIHIVCAKYSFTLDHSSAIIVSSFKNRFKVFLHVD